MKNYLFLNDLVRFGPFATVLLATLASLESIREFMAGQVTLSAMVERYFIAFFLSMLAVRLFTKLVFSYIKDPNTSSFVGNGGKQSKKSKKG
ncbi:MAG: hypothetical protein M1374_04850 [Firmicutes bacterium]|jgi:hypothetical protein|nr:hypothetical protein [Bacillota bacterium]